MADDFSISWRTLDASGWGVPQRRKRVYLVADFDGQCAGKILFESEGLSGYSSQNFRAWQDATRYSENSTRTAISTLMFENHSQACRYKGPLDKSNTILATFGMGGNNQPFVVHTYGISSKGSNAMQSANPHSGVYQADIARTLDTSNQSPDKNQGGIIVLEGNGTRPSHHGNGYKASDTMYTLNCTENHAVAVFSSSKSSRHTVTEEEKASTLVATDYKDPPIVYDCIVRRLTPKECALLQGFPAWWCLNLESESPSEEEISRWAQIFQDIGKKKSKKSVEKWLKSPHSDSAEYKLWGNGVALPCVYFVMSGIAYYTHDID